MNFKHIVHREKLGTRLVEIYDTQESRSLYFGGKYLQSQIFHDSPEQLALIYTRYMAANLLLVKEMRRIALIGIGAGSFIHFFHHHFPQCRIDCVDHSERIIEIAQDFFGLKENDQVHVHCLDGRDFLAASTDSLPYDLILVDAFDEEGMAAGIYESSFFELCRDRLHQDGVASFNLWHQRKSAVTMAIRELRENFDHNYLLPIPFRGNVIANMLHKPVNWQKLLPEKARCEELEDKYLIEFRAIGKQAIKHNLSPVRRLRRLLRNIFPLT